MNGAKAANNVSHGSGEMQGHPVFCFLDDLKLRARNRGMKPDCVGGRKMFVSAGPKYKGWAGYFGVQLR